MSPRTAVVVVSYGSHALTARLLGGLDLPALDAVALVVDNFSDADERRTVTALAESSGWTLLPLPNVGFGAAVNRAVEEAARLGCTEVVLLNPDLVVTTEVVAALVADVRADPTLLVAPTVLTPEGTVWFAGGEVRVAEGRAVTRDADSTSPTGWVTGACLAAGLERWRRVGGFDEGYFLYWEDVDLSWRWRRSGGRLAVRRDLTAVHDVGGTQGAGKSLAYYRWNCRNRLLFAAKNLPAERWRWARTSVTAARTVLRRGGLGRPWRATHLRPVLAAGRGTLGGLRTLLRP